jgi:glycerol-3-phosphate O-acyltransferase
MKMGQNRFQNLLYYSGKLLYLSGFFFRKFKIYYYRFHPFKKDLKSTFGSRIKEVMQNSDPNLFAVTTPDNVYQEAQPKNRPYMNAMLQNYVKKGSGLEGVENFLELHGLAQKGKSTVIMSSHFSNFDVPTLSFLFKEHSEEMEEYFEDIIFIAGRKLTEGCKYVKALSELYNRLVISAKALKTTDEEMKLAMKINKSAQKKLNKLKSHGKIFLLYPTGTRCRPLIPKTHRGIREIYNYLRKFDYFICLGMRGNLMPTLDEGPMINEYPKKGKIVYNFGSVKNTSDFIKMQEADLFEGIDAKQYIIDKVMNEIYSLGHDPRKNKFLLLYKYVQNRDSLMN